MRSSIFLKTTKVYVECFANNNTHTLVKETHGSLSQCVSFSLIDVGSGFSVYVVFFLFNAWIHSLTPLYPPQGEFNTSMAH